MKPCYEWSPKRAAGEAMYGRAHAARPLEPREVSGARPSVLKPDRIAALPSSARRRTAYRGHPTPQPLAEPPSRSHGEGTVCPGLQVR